MQRRSTRQTSKPVNIDLIRTPMGYELYEEKVVNLPPSIQKPVMPRQDKPLNYSKSLVGKIGEKVPGTPPSSGYNLANDQLMRSRTSVKPPMGNPKINFQNGVNFPERSPGVRPPVDTIKREINSFSNLSMPPIRMGPGESVGGDPFVSHQFGRTDMPGMGAESMYSKPVQKFQKKFPVTIPSCSIWFDMDKIHQIEKESVPEFFQGRPAKTPEVYKRFRNYMIHQYRKDPANYLSATTCRKTMGGDACTLMRIHGFLEHWGLINFYIEPSSYPMKSTFLNKVNYSTERAISTQNDFPMDVFEREKDVNELLSKMKSLNRNSKPICDFCGYICGFTWYQLKSPEQKSSVIPETDTNGTLQPPPTDDSKKLVDLGKKIILCINCFDNQSFPKLYSQNDFHKVEPFGQNEQGRGSQPVRSWSNEETLRLLDLIQKFGENWTEIQRALPHRSKEELVAHYIKLPVSNITALNIVEMGEFKGHEDTGNEKISDQVPTVFADFSNPVLQHVAIYKSLLTKFRDQKKEKERLIQEAIDAQKEKERLAQEAIEAEKQKEIKAEERSDLEITKISESAKEGGEGNMEEEVKQNEDEMKIENIEGAEGNGENVENPEQIAENAETNEVIEQEPEPVKTIEIEAEKPQEDDGKMVEEVIPEVPKTQEQIAREIADRAVELQVVKLNEKLDFLMQYENLLLRERIQQDMLHQSFITEKIEVAKKKPITIKPQHPPGHHQPHHAPQQHHGPMGPTSTVPKFEAKEPAFYPFGGPDSFGEDSIDFAEGGNY